MTNLWGSGKMTVKFYKPKLKKPKSAPFEGRGILEQISGD
jgi:hypothetical protein